MNYEVHKEEEVFNDHYKMLKATVTHDTFGGAQLTVDRLAFHRGDSVAILLYEADTESVILTRQFRYPTTLHHIGWMYEIPAGSMESDEPPVACVIRETKEEVGYSISHPTKIAHFYPSPGACTEICHLFYAEVTQADHTSKGGGVDAEDEDIEIVKIPVSKIASFMEETIIDGKTLIALQWFLQNKK
ncbi:MAG: ADP-ribose pyrophosphatase [Flavobacteriaceae bacterium]|nr:ADP-ribose pyrophosphatase [Flavobacteriaceae bacterium]|tara:strand:- start:23659 stop:24222 length:564 start_codon:yes stop_codon:yes gene_type:complete